MKQFGAFDAYVIDNQVERERQAELSRLTDKLNDYCDEHSLPHESADELLSQLYREEPRRVELCRWLDSFIEEWDAVV